MVPNSSPIMTKYCHFALTGITNIRLLRFDKESTLKEGPNSPNEPLKIILTEADLLHGPSFEALSYTWGDAKNKMPISVHGNQLKITVHLDRFLRQLLQSVGDRNEDQYFWADQICINQEDIPERNAQVALMAEIYQRSQRTLVWVDEADSDTELVAKLLTEMEKLVGMGQTKLNEVMDAAHLTADRFWRELERDTPSNTDIYRPFTNTLNRPWFTRSWVIQEVALARETYLFLGPRSFRWESLDLLVIALAWLQRARDGTVQDSWVLRTRAAHTSRHVQFCRRIWQSRKSEFERGNFLETLRRLAFATECSDPRDLVFAFLSLQQAPILPPADYSLDIVQVYCATSAMLAAESGNLNILGQTRRAEYIGTTSDGKRIPSWAIDWRYNDSTQGSPLSDPKSGYTASRNFAYRPETLNAVGAVLTVKGKIVDTVGVVSPHHTSPITIKSLMSEILRHECFALYDMLGARTVDDLDKISIRAAKAVLSYDAARDASVWDGNSQLLPILQDIHASLESQPRHRTKEQTERVLHVQSMISRARKKRLYLSRERVLFGLAPWIVVPGDIVCILHGSSVPIMLRKSPSNGRFTVVGQCYLEEWMQGEHLYRTEEEAETFQLE